jgi:hypothetical protein
MLQALDDNQREEDALPSLAGTYDVAERLERRRKKILKVIEELQNVNANQIPLDETSVLAILELMNNAVSLYNVLLNNQQEHEEEMLALIQLMKNNSVLQRWSRLYPQISLLFKMISWIEYSNNKVSHGIYNFILTLSSSFYPIFLKYNSNDTYGVLTSAGQILVGSMTSMILLNFTAKVDNSFLNTRKFRIEKFKEDLLLKSLNKDLRGIFTIRRPELDSYLSAAEPVHRYNPFGYLDYLIDFRANRIKFAAFFFLFLMDKLISHTEKTSDSTNFYILAIISIVQFRLILYPSAMAYANRLDHALMDKAERNDRWLRESNVSYKVIECIEETAQVGWDSTVRLSQSTFSWWHRPAPIEDPEFAADTVPLMDAVIVEDEQATQPRMSA